MDEELKKLIRDYHRDNRWIARQKYKWLTPKKRKYETRKQDEVKDVGEKKTR